MNEKRMHAMVQISAICHALEYPDISFFITVEQENVFSLDENTYYALEKRCIYSVKTFFSRQLFQRAY